MSLPPEFFDDFYAAGGADPWGFTSRWYEQRKRALTLAALPRTRYRRGLEPGCSTGVLSTALAQRCEALVATDVAEAALAEAARRVPGNVELRRWGLRDPWPDETFDLVVLSEVGYYLDADALEGEVPHVIDALEPGGTLVLAHWRHDVPEYPLSGDVVHRVVSARAGLARVGGWLDDDLRLDVLERADAPVPSVASRDGLV